MYHIKDDKRTKRSAELICSGLLECLKTKKFSEITITDVQVKATVGRATFYRLFDQLPDVLSYMLDNVFINIKDIPYDSSRSIHEQYMEPALELWMKNADLLQIIIEAKRLDIIYESHKRMLNKFKNVIDPVLDDDYLNDYLIGIAAFNMIGILSIWLRKGKKESAAELAQLFNKITEIALGTNNHTE